MLDWFIGWLIGCFLICWFVNVSATCSLNLGYNNFDFIDFRSMFGRSFDQNWVLRRSWDGSGKVLGACWSILGS